jgi:integrase/recombinase XerD
MMVVIFVSPIITAKRRLQMLLSEALRELDLSKVGNTTDSTRAWYRRRVGSLIKFLGDVDVEMVTVLHLRRWKASLVERNNRWADHPTRPEVEGGLSPWTIRGHVRAVRHFFKWLVDEGLLANNPAARFKMPPKPPNEPKAVDPDDVLAMLNVADTRDQAIVRFLASTGCRVGGVADLRLSDLELDRRRATVREKHRGGKKARRVYFGASTARALAMRIEIRPASEDDHVFLGRQGSLTEGGIYLVLKRLAQEAGVEGRFNPHSFRHAFARGALQNGADLGTASEMMDHGGIGVTHEFYARWADDELERSHRKYSWFDQVE